MFRATWSPSPAPLMWVPTHADKGLPLSLWWLAFPTGQVACSAGSISTSHPAAHLGRVPCTILVSVPNILELILPRASLWVLPQHPSSSIQSPLPPRPQSLLPSGIPDRSILPDPHSCPHDKGALDQSDPPLRPTSSPPQPLPHLLPVPPCGSQLLGSWLLLASSSLGIRAIDLSWVPYPRTLPGR